MKFAIASAVLPLLALAACGGGGADANSGAPAAPVAAAPAPAGQKWVDVVTRTPEGGFRMGNPDAPVKLVEFGSRTCHICKAFEEEGFAPLTKNYVATGKVSFEFRDFLRNGLDLSAALLGQCNGPGPFFPILAQTFAAQPEILAKAEKLPQSFYTDLAAKPPAEQPMAFAETMGFIDFAKQRGIPEAKARQCLADTKAAEAIAKSTENASRQYNIPGTPTFLINGKVIDNTVNWQQVEAALKAAGA